MLQQILDKAHTLKIAVIGDFIEDRYIIGDVERISPEAPVPVLVEKERKSTWGGAGNVFMNLHKLGVNTFLFADIHPMFNIYIEDQGLSDLFGHPRPHSVKTRFMSGSHQIMRLDNDVSIPDGRRVSEVAWWGGFEIMVKELDCVVIADYHKTVVSESVADSIIDTCNIYGVPVIVDAKKDYHKFNDATIIKCNGKEWASQEFRSTTEFIQKRNIDAVVITHGEGGMELTDRGNNSIPFDYKIARLHDVQIVDVCGAGDTVTAILAMGAAMKSPRYDAIEIANRLAAEVCKFPGVYPIQRSDVERIIKETA